MTDFGLTHRERGFVEAVVSGSADSAAEAARQAGYSTPTVSAASTVGHIVAQKPQVRAAIAAAFAEQGLNEGWVAGRLRTYGEDENPNVRAPAVRSVELAARILGMLQPESTTVIDARSIIVPGSAALSIDDLTTMIAQLEAPTEEG
jgi:hypothetical protein